MSLPKIFTAGERLFAADLNSNFEHLEDEVEIAKPKFETSASDTVAINFSQDRVITRSATGNVTFTASNYTQGNAAVVRIVAGGSQRTLTFPSGWKFVSIKPANLAANKIGILTVTSFGTTEADVAAAFAWEA